MYTIYQEIFGREKLGEFTLFEHLEKKVWLIDRSAKRLFIVSTNLDGFSLANHRRFAKFTKLSRHTVNATMHVLTRITGSIVV